MKLRTAILLFIILSASFVVTQKMYTVGGQGNAEAICIMENSSAKETVVWNTLYHNGRLYPVESEKRDGCLIIYEAGMEKDYPFAVFVDNDYDHCCMDGE